MKDFFRSKFFTVIVIITLFAAIVPSVLYAMGLGDFVRNGVNTVLIPVQKLFTLATDALDGFSSYFTEFDRITEENRQLRERINTLEDKIYSAQELEEMNEWLYDYLELKREHTDYKFEAANVTGRESANYMRVFTLDRGKAHNVRAGMPVITSEGIVGYITEAGTDWSKAVTLLESGSAVGAYIERTGELGIVEGDYSLASEGLCILSYLSETSDIKEGDRIMSSGYGSVYPRGLVIGYVQSVEKNEFSRSAEAYIKPAADLSDISKLMVITEYETYSK